MNKTILTLLSLVSCCISARSFGETFGTGQNEFEIELVFVGDAGNRPDLTGNPRPAGGVDYVYNIGKHEISRVMIEKASAEGGLALTLHPMDFMDGGPRPDMAATGVSWNEAARFVNWLNTSQGFPVAYKFSTQPGDVDYEPNANIELWDATDFGADAANRFRNSQARYVLPDVDEWYKAAYYDPNAFEGNGDYWNFPNGSFDPPTPVSSGTDPGTAVMEQRTFQGPADITQAGGLSPYGVMALGGNVWEWEETEFDLVNDDPGAIRAARGGRWLSGVGHAKVYDRDDDDLPTFELQSLGFRIVSVPAPGSQTEIEVTPGVGKFQDTGAADGSLIVEQIRDGYRIKVFQEGPSDGAIPRLSASWDAEEGQWYRFDAQVKSVSITNDTANPQNVIADLESPAGIRFGLQILEPDPPSETYGFDWQFNPDGSDFGDVSLTWEFTAVPIDTPIPGDANGDGVVGFDDFLQLANGFPGSREWSAGNFDGSADGTQFSDFLLLANNFGKSSAASVPEPCAAMLLLFGVIGFVQWRRILVGTHR